MNSTASCPPTFTRWYSAEVEAPLLEEVMAYTRNNQTKASIMLGLNRGTLRKKLKQYGLIAQQQLTPRLRGLLRSTL